MKKINYLFWILILIIAAGCKTEQQTSGQKHLPEKPNILFLFADDQRADAIGSAGNQHIQTPALDGLSNNGIRFTNCYVMGSHHGAVCAPSRAMLMTGKSLFRVYDRLEGEITMPMYFGLHGYETFGTGKWHNTAKSFEASFQKGENVFLDGMSDHYKVPCRQLEENGKLSEPMNKGYSTDLFSEAAIRYINEYADGNKEKPFFCYVAFTAPHDPRSPREDFINMYNEQDLPLPENYMEFHPFEFDDMNIRDETLAPWPRTPEVIKASLADYYALISHMDKCVGDVISTLKKTGLHDNTIIVYASDNGLAIGSHGLLGKQNLYEHSIKVPFIMSGPGIPVKDQTDALVYLYDIFPTLAALCGLPEPEDADGTNLLPVIRNTIAEVRGSLYTAYRNTVRAVRSDNFKLIWYPQRNHMQLFDLIQDPAEVTNLVSIPEYENTVKEMMMLMENWHQVSEDTMNLYPGRALSLEYDHTKLQQTPDRHQPAYVLKKYFNR
jgi:arylsulfatase A-like enzyme